MSATMILGGLFIEMVLRWEKENEENNCHNEEGKSVGERDNNQDGSLVY